MNNWVWPAIFSIALASIPQIASAKKAVPVVKWDYSGGSLGCTCTMTCHGTGGFYSLEKVVSCVGTVTTPVHQSEAKCVCDCPCPYGYEGVVDTTILPNSSVPATIVPPVTPDLGGAQ